VGIGPYTPRMARIQIPDGPQAEGRRVFGLRPEMAGTVTEMIDAVYHRSMLAAAEQEVARMRVAQLNDCSACSTARAQSVIDAGVPEEAYGHLDEWRTWPGYTERQRLAIEYAERFTVDHQAIDDQFFARLRASYSDEEILDLTLCLAIWLGLGRTLAVLQVDQRTGVMADL
jgi:alkylhydroperoxidase family enzyme